MRFDAVIHPSPRAASKPELQGDMSSFRILINHAIIIANKIPASTEARAYALPPL